MKRAKYFSDDDWSIGRALERAEKVLAEYESGAQCSDINSALELYNIQKLFQIGAKLPEWSEEYFHQLTQKAAGHSSTIGAFWKTVEDKNFIETYKNTEKLYRDNFWEEFERHKTYRKGIERNVPLLFENPEAVDHVYPAAEGSCARVWAGTGGAYAGRSPERGTAVGLLSRLG